MSLPRRAALGLLRSYDDQPIISPDSARQRGPMTRVYRTLRDISTESQLTIWAYLERRWHYPANVDRYGPGKRDDEWFYALSVLKGALGDKIGIVASLPEIIENTQSDDNPDARTPMSILMRYARYRPARLRYLKTLANELLDDALDEFIMKWEEEEAA